MSEKKYVTLLQLSENIKAHIQATYTTTYRIKAEIIKLNHYKKSGHCFPDLAEKENGIIKAQMRATIWASTYKKIDEEFLRITREPLHEGMTVLIKAHVNYHELYGMSLNIVDIEPEFTLGEMARERQQTIEKLKKQGLFNKNKSLPPPLLAKKVAVISVNTSKGYSDFVQTLNNPESPFTVQHTLFPALLQGDKAVDSLIRALNRIKREYKKYDVVTIIRGGGDDVGLNCYDHYNLARAIADFPLPVITGIGHSTNETVSEMVAFKNRITPTDVAYALLNDYVNVQKFLEWAQNLVTKKTPQFLNTTTHSLSNNTRRFQSIVKYQLQAENNKIFNFGQNLKHDAKKTLKEERNVLYKAGSGLSTQPLKVMNEAKALLKYNRKILKLKSTGILTSESAKIESIINITKWADPIHTLKRGYSVTMYNGKPVTSEKQLTAGDEITTKLANGKVKSIVTNKD